MGGDRGGYCLDLCILHKGKGAVTSKPMKGMKIIFFHGEKLLYMNRDEFIEV